MTPSPPHRRTVTPDHRRRLLRRAAAVTASLLVVGGAPIVAVALGGDVDNAPAATETASAREPNWSPTVRALPADNVSVRTSARATRTFDLDLDADPSTPPTTSRVDDAASPTADPTDDAVPDGEVLEAGLAEAAALAAEAEAVAIAAAVLADSYEWDERSDRVAVLQGMLDVHVDGWYAWATLRAHRGVLEAAGLPVDALPVAPVRVAPTAVANASGVSSGPSASAWAALRNCESGGSYSITNPSGKYRGAYQFDRPTWNSVAGRHAPGLVGVDPAGASPSDQDAMARALYSERGSSPWPQCGRHL